MTINLRALDALPGAGEAAPEPKPAPRPAPRPTAERKTATTTAARSLPPPSTTALPTPPVAPAPAAQAVATPAPPTASAPMAALVPAPPPATLPTAPPATVALAPITPPALPANTPPPPAPPVSAGAGTTATPDTTGLQLVFKPAESELSPDASAAIGKLVKATPDSDTISYNVIAYASGTADDPSVARRTSLARGLSVRGALIADGVPSTRIYVRALGAAGGASPPDRVEVTVMGLSGAIPVKQ